MSRGDAINLYQTYDQIVAMIVGMINQSDKWTMTKQEATIREEPEHYDFNDGIMDDE